MSDKPITTGVRLEASDRKALEEIAENNGNTVAGILRLGVAQLIKAAKENDGYLPPSILDLRDRAEASNPEAATAGAR